MMWFVEFICLLPSRHFVLLDGCRYNPGADRFGQNDTISNLRSGIGDNFIGGLVLQANKTAVLEEAKRREEEEEKDN